MYPPGLMLEFHPLWLDASRNSEQKGEIHPADVQG